MKPVVHVQTLHAFNVVDTLPSKQKIKGLCDLVIEVSHRGKRRHYHQQNIPVDRDPPRGTMDDAVAFAGEYVYLCDDAKCPYVTPRTDGTAPERAAWWN